MEVENFSVSRSLPRFTNVVIIIRGHQIKVANSENIQLYGLNVHLIILFSITKIVRYIYFYFCVIA